MTPDNPKDPTNEEKPRGPEPPAQRGLEASDRLRDSEPQAHHPLSVSHLLKPQKGTLSHRCVAVFPSIDASEFIVDRSNLERAAIDASEFVVDRSNLERAAS